MRLLKKCFLYTFSFLVLLIATLLITLTTRPGLSAVVILAETVTPGKLHIGSAKGNLLHALHLDNINYTNETQTITVDQVDLHWRPAHLLAGRLYIPKLSINHLTVTSKETTQESETTPNPLSIPDITLPIDFTLDNITLLDLNIDGTKIDTIHLAADSHENIVNITTLSVSAFDANIHTQGNIDLNTPLSAALNSTVQANIGHNQTLQANVDLEGSLQKLIITITSKAPFNANIHAALNDILEKPNVKLNAHWEKIAFSPEKAKHYRSKLGDLRFSGSLDDYELDIKADIAGDEIPRANIATNARGNREKATLNKLSIETLGGKFSGQAKLTWKPILSWEAVLTAEHINPAEKWHDIPGDINFNLTSAGRKETTLLTHTTISDITGSLRNFKIKGNLNVTSDDNLITLKDTLINLDDATIQINGDLLKHWNFNWDIDIPHMYSITPYGSGSVVTQGSIQGNTDTPNIELTAVVKQLSVQDIQVKQLNVKGNVDLGPQKNSTLSIAGNTFRYGDFALDKLTASFKGTTEKHAIELSLQNPDLKLITTLNAGYNQEHWAGQITKFNTNIFGSKTWKLEKPADFTISQTIANLSPLTLSLNDQSIALQGSWDNTQKLNATFDINNLSLSQFAKALPENLTLHGSTDFHARISRENQTNPLLASVNGTLTPGWVEYPIDSVKHKITFEGGKLTANLDQQGLHSAFVLNLNEKTPIDIEFALPKLDPLTTFDMNQPIEGKINLAINNLDIIPTLSPEIEEATGILTSNLTLGGTVNKPEINGAITLKDGLLTLPNFGLKIYEINLSLTGNPDYTLALNGTMKSGEGDLTLKSQITPSLDNLNIKTQITGTNFQVMNSKEYAVSLSPNLTLDYVPERLTLGGNIDLIQADIQPRDFSSTVSLPENVSYKGVEKESNPFQIDGDVTLKIINPIHFKMQGLDANIIGNLKITLIPEAVPLGNGELNVTKGSYTAYGQDLTITKARFMYNETPLSNPGISIRAIRKVKVITSSGGSDSINETTVGVIAQGTPRNLHLSLFSDPSGLSQGDILSYIMLGRSQDRVSAAQAALLLQAIASSHTGNDNSNDFGKKIQDTLGLDEVTFEDNPQIDPTTNQAEDNTSLVIAKKLTDKISLQYSQGLIVNVSTIRLIYNMTKRISAQAEASSVEQGADVYYTIEK